MISLAINIKDYGAIGDGLANDTNAIGQAISSAASQGGGEVYFPAGIYKSSSIELKSDITLHFENGSKLLASPNSADWANCNDKSLIQGINVSNVTIRGSGEINCSGPVFHGDRGYRLEIDKPHNAVKFKNSTNITMVGVTVKDAVGWTIHFDNCEYVTVDGIIIRNPEFTKARNTDGIDINGCRHVIIRNCDIETGDDAICLKNIDRSDDSYKRPDMFDIVVQNCVLASTCNSTKIGTETVGDIYDVTFDGITVNKHANTSYTDYPAERGLALSAISVQSNDGAKVHDISFKNYRVNEVDAPFFILLAERKHYAPKMTVGAVYNIALSNIDIVKSYRTSIINVCSGYSIGRVSLNNVIIKNYETRNTVSLPDRPGDVYPDPQKYGIMPAYGLFARDVTELVIEGGSSFNDSGNSGRPETVFENVNVKK